MNIIKNIVFDLGNVLVDLDFGKTQRAFSKILGKELVFDNYQQESASLFRDIEVGKISSQVFLMELQAITGTLTPLASITEAWNAMLLGIAAPRFEMLRQLKKDYQLFVLSNTNEIHMDWIFKHIEVDHGIANFQRDYFDKIYLSHLIQKRKPDADIFEFVSSDAGILPEETLFIDDKEENILTAKNLSWQTLWHHPENEIVAILKDFLSTN